jgi:hypothetical protein
MNLDYREEKHGRNWRQNNEVLAVDEHSVRRYQLSERSSCENDQGSMPRHSFSSSHHGADRRSCQ